MELLPNKGDNFKFKFLEQADPRTLSLLEKLINGLGFLLQAVRSIRIDLPKIYTVQGMVNVGRILDLPPVSVKNLQELTPYFAGLSKEITNLQLETINLVSALEKAQKNQKDLKFPETFNIKGFNDLLADMEELKKGFNLLINKEQIAPASKVEITNFPIQKYPLPVTNININPLQGFGKSTNQTLTTVLSTIPSYGQLFHRRALVIFNNSAATTIYIGGSDVTSDNGLPVLAQASSPVIDAGYNMIIYGLTASGTADIRVFELSRDQSDTVQQ